MNASSDSRRRRLPLAMLALAVSGLLLLFHYYVVRPSCIANTAEMRYELSCRDFNQATCLDDWMWEQRTPYKYRILGRVPVWAVYAGLQRLGVDADHAALYAFAAFLFTFTASTLWLLGELMWVLLQRLYPGQDGRTRWLLLALSWALFLSSPPILFFVKYPVRGAPNDLLGFSLMIGALLLQERRRIAAFTAVCVAAVFCRETTLLMPFIFLVADPLPLRRKVLPALLPVAALVAYRLAWPGYYDPIPAGLPLNLKVPVETLAFFLLTFGPLWILCPLGWALLRRLPAAQADPFVRGLVRSFPWGAALALGICILLTSLYEIRTSYILLFYFVPFSALFLYEERRRLLALLRNRWFLLFQLALLIEGVRFWFWMHPLTEEGLYQRAAMFDIIFFGYWNHPQDNWVNSFVIYLFLTLACLPLLLLLRSRQAATQAPAP